MRIRSFAGLLLLLGAACAPAGGPAREGSTPSPALAWRQEIAPFAVHDTAGRALTLAFFGGLNIPRPQLVDIDGDGDLDLFVQEYGGRLTLFERDGEADGLPRFRLKELRFSGLDIGEWYRFADLDGDGDFDLLAESPFSYIRYYRNEGTRQAPRLVVAVDTLKDVQGTPIFSDRQNIPQLGDLDCDNVPDLLIGRVDGTVTRYEMDAARGALTPVFRLLADQFEDIKIVGQMGSLHGANTMALADYDGDGDPDLFWGDFFEQGLLLIENAGSCQTFNFRSEPVQFPRGAPLLTSGYNAPTWGDVDGDGAPDLVMGVLGGAFNPNRTSVENLYLMTGSVRAGWTVQTRMLLPMLDVGSESIPHLVDLDGDGDLDLLLANKIDQRDLTSARIYHFENTGTRTAPALRMRGAIPITGSYHFAPAVADLDGDGRLDMLLGRWTGHVAHHRQAGGGWELVDSTAITITRGSNTTPTLGDLDGDGDLDLLIGEASGALNYYRNDGSARGPVWVLVSDTWEGIDIGRRSTPQLYDIDGDGDLDLLIGSEVDGVTLYRNAGTRTAYRFEKDEGFRIDAPALAAPTLGDLDGDGRPELLLGGVSGGVLYFRR